jgi:hypothetical protein
LGKIARIGWGEQSEPQQNRERTTLTSIHGSFYSFLVGIRFAHPNLCGLKIIQPNYQNSLLYFCTGQKQVLICF